jgi:hypothetical protein
MVMYDHNIGHTGSTQLCRLDFDDELDIWTNYDTKNPHDTARGRLTLEYADPALMDKITKELFTYIHQCKKLLLVQAALRESHQ